MLIALLVYVEAEGHNEMIKRCFTTDGTVKKIGEDLWPNGMVIEGYDRDGDGKVDIEVASLYHGSEIQNGEIVLRHNKSPLFYYVDHNWDGEIDEIQVDVRDDGNCSGLVHHEPPDQMHPNPIKQVTE